MAMTDPIADMLARIRNGHMAKLGSVACPSSNMRKGVLDVLQSEGYIRGYDEKEVRKGVKELNIELKYYEGQPVIKELKRISRPGLRRYSKIKDLPKVYNGLGISIVSTSKGIMADHEAKKQNVSGEVLCSVF